MAGPNFLIIGAAKAGTTSLYHYLRQHPDVYMSPVKETRYYCDDDVQGVPTRTEYEQLFARVNGQRAIGEASPQYLNSISGPGRIAADIPRVRLIVSLRNPADRAYSSYLGRIRGGTERRLIDDALRPGTYYFETSLYYPRLLRYFEAFDRGQIHVVLFDDLVADPRTVMRGIHEFLGVDAEFRTEMSQRHNVGCVPRSIAFNSALLATRRVARRVTPQWIPPSGIIGLLQRAVGRRPDPLPATIRRRLLEQFRDDIDRTGALIARDLTSWLR